MRYEQHSSQLMAMNAVGKHWAEFSESGQPPLSTESHALSRTNAEQRTTGKAETDPDGSSRSLQKSEPSASEQLLLMLGALPLSTTEPSNTQDTLRPSMTEASCKAAEKAEDVKSSTEFALRSQLQSVHSMQQKLLDSLLADTAYRDVMMCDQDLSSRKSVLESSNRSIGSGLARLDMEKAHDLNRHRDALVDRWGTQ